MIQVRKVDGTDMDPDRWEKVIDDKGFLRGFDWFEKQEEYITGIHCPLTQEFVIEPLNVRLIKPRVDTTILVQIDPASVGWYKDIREQMLEAEQMELNKDIVELREKYEKLTPEEKAKWTEYRWIEPRPFRTNIGDVKIKSCLVTGLAQVTIEGKTYQDKLMRLVGWLAQEAKKATKTEDDIEDLLEGIGINVEEKKDVKVDDLFKPKETWEELFDDMFKGD